MAGDGQPVFPPGIFPGGMFPEGLFGLEGEPEPPAIEELIETSLEIVTLIETSLEIVTLDITALELL